MVKIKCEAFYTCGIDSDRFARGQPNHCSLARAINRLDLNPTNHGARLPNS